MKKKSKLVSIILNCYNGEKYLAQALASIQNQNYNNWELIFWDNQSTDSSASIVKSFEDDRIKYFLAPNHTSIGKARAEAYQFMKGDYVAVLDVDDLWLPLVEDELLLELGIFHQSLKIFYQNDGRFLLKLRYQFHQTLKFLLLFYLPKYF